MKDNGKALSKKGLNALFGFLSGQKFAQAGIWYVAANVIGNGVVLISSAVFTRILSKSDYGLVSTYSSWAVLLTQIISLNLYVSTRNAFLDYREEYDCFNSSVFLLSLLSGFGFLIISFAFNKIIHTGISSFELICAFIHAIALHTVYFEMTVLSMKNSFRRRSVLVAAPNIVHTLLSILFILLIPLYPYYAKIGGNALGLLLFAVISALAIVKRSALRINLKYWKYALVISLPAVLNSLSDLILMQSDRLMLTAMTGPAETAEYSLIYNIGAIAMVIYQAINGAWTAWFFRITGKKNYELSKKFQRLYLYLFTVVSLGILAISPECIKLLSPKSYWGGSRYVGWIITASFSMFLYTFFSTLLLYQKRTKTTAMNTGIVAVLNLLLNYYMIPSLGAKGAIIATVISYLLLLVLHFLAARKEGVKFFDIKQMIIYLAVVIMSASIHPFVADYWLLRYALYLICFLLSLKLFGLNLIRGFLTRGKADNAAPTE